MNVLRPNKEFVQSIRQYIVDNKTSISAFAVKCHINRRFMQYVMNEVRDPDLKQLRRIAKQMNKKLVIKFE